MLIKYAATPPRTFPCLLANPICPIGSEHLAVRRLSSTSRATTRYGQSTNQIQFASFTLTPTQVSQIKEKVEEKEGIPPVQQRLIYGGKQMYVHLASCGLPETSRLTMYRTDDRTAADYNLAGGDTLHLVLALRGGL